MDASQPVSAKRHNMAKHCQLSPTIVLLTVPCILSGARATRHRLRRRSTKPLMVVGPQRARHQVAFAATMRLGLQGSQTVRCRVFSAEEEGGDFGGQMAHSMRIGAPSGLAIIAGRIFFIALLCYLGSLLSPVLVFAGAGAALPSAPPPAPNFLAGNTLSAVTWIMRPTTASGVGGLHRVFLQAYLRQDGSALVRVWDSARNAYTRPAERNWTLVGARLCLDLANPGPGRICAEIHSWGPRIAGVGTAPYVILDGDLKPGNALLATR